MKTKTYLMIVRFSASLMSLLLSAVTLLGELDFDLFSDFGTIRKFEDGTSRIDFDIFIFCYSVCNL